jgi:hypothetical protein
MSKILIVSYILLSFFYPLLSSISRVGFMFLFFVTSTYLIVTKVKIKSNFFYLILFSIMSTVIYLFGLLIGVVNGNDINLVFLDSAGFVFYIVLLPIALFIIKDKSNLEFFKSSLINVSIVFSITSLLIIFIFYYFFGKLDLNTITIGNNFISNYLNLKLGATAGLLRVNTNSVQIIFLSLFVVLSRNKCSLKDKAIVFLFFLAILADGHRAAVLIFALMYFTYIIIYKRWVNFSIIFLLIFLTISYKSDTILNRMDFSSKSTTARIDQVVPLVDKISESLIIGSGFGSSASLIRNDIRPFMYEMDSLAIAMKLGIPFAILYTLMWFILLTSNNKFKFNSRFSLFSIISLIGCLFYMTTNGGFYMSPLTTILQFLIVLVFTQLIPQHSRQPTLLKSSI